MHDSDPVYEYLMKPYGISKDDLQEAFKSPDHIHKLKANNIVKGIFIKQISNDYYLLIDANLKDRNHSIQTVFRIFPQTLQGITLKTPIHVLRKIANEFGYALQMGNYSSKFIFNETLKIPESDKINNELEHYLTPVDFPKNADRAFGSSLYTVKTGYPNSSFKIEIAYLISLKKYTEYQHENES